MDYDLAIIGAGWAGFNAALRAKELGLKVALIDRGAIGGACLNRGCIPTKALIQSAKIYNLAKKAKTFGIELNTPAINFPEIQARKAKIILKLGQGMEFMLKGVDYFAQEAQILSANTVKIGNDALKARFILIATGAKPVELDNLKFDGKKIISSDDILNLKEIPKSLLIIGGGVIGCEFASLFSTLGSAVTVIEKMPQLLPGEDVEIGKKIEAIFKKRGIKVITNTGADTAGLNSFDTALVCVGRSPEFNNLGLEKLRVKLEKGKIVVDEYLKTNVTNIYAAGDCTGKIMLAHFAAYQGRVAAENIFNSNEPKPAHNTNIPNCIFTDPEIASVGLNEEKAKRQGLDIKVNKFDFLGIGMAHILDEIEGFVKIISENKTGQILGGSIIGPKATELIAVITLALSSHLKASQIKDTIFAHPTLSESIGETLK